MAKPKAYDGPERRNEERAEGYEVVDEPTRKQRREFGAKVAEATKWARAERKPDPKPKTFEEEMAEFFGGGKK